MITQESIEISQFPVTAEFDVVGHGVVFGNNTGGTRGVARQLAVSEVGSSPITASYTTEVERLTEEKYDFLKRLIGDSKLPRVGHGQTVTSMGTSAARIALEMAYREEGIEVGDVGIAKAATSTAIRPVPEMTKDMHSFLGLGLHITTGTHANACQGGLDAFLEVGKQLDRLPGSSVGLVVASEVLSKKLATDDIDTQGIFSDMAAAFVLRYKPGLNKGLVLEGFATDSSSRENLTMGPGEEDMIEMIGKRVAAAIAGVGKHSVHHALIAGNKLLETLNDGLEEPKYIADVSGVDPVASHQPGEKTLRILFKKLGGYGILPHMVPDLFKETGNASAATTLGVMSMLMTRGIIVPNSHFGAFSAAVGSSARFAVIRT